MRKNNFIIGFLCGACIFGGTAVLANTDVLARLTSQIFFWNHEKIELEAYNINGYNYVRLRDAAKIFDVNIEYDAITDSVYMGEIPVISTETAKVEMIDGTAYAREDFSLAANSDIFDEVYTRDAYNAKLRNINANYTTQQLMQKCCARFVANGNRLCSCVREENKEDEI